VLRIHPLEADVTTPTEQPEALRLAERLASNIVTGHDWPNTNDELLRVQCATELRRLHAAREADREAMRMALEALKAEHSAIYGDTKTVAAIKALEQRVGES
jgi:hypothetical protein